MSAVTHISYKLLFPPFLPEKIANILDVGSATSFQIRQHQPRFPEVEIKALVMSLNFSRCLTNEHENVWQHIRQRAKIT